MKRITLDIIMAAGLILSLFLGSFGAFAADCEKLQNEVLRLHIPANSDSAEDQQIKLMLRDYILEEYGPVLSEEKDVASAVRRAEQLLDDIEASCNEFLCSQGAGYTASASLTQMYFTTRVYDNVTLPAGTYTALRITLGSGEGQNWWCVMFPPLCIPMAADKDELCDVIPSELSDGADTGEVRIKLALFEFFKSFLAD
ncbi:MAG: stage II sporulation protein R [Oscillospiraceae bacterium]